ncbi:MAG: class I SAM-dependent methyltransferase, partial [Planctomycetota bacterium]
MPTWRPFDWYEHDPLYYDIVFDADTAKEAAFLEAVHARHGAGGRRMLEPACGSGRLVLAMAKAGYDVTGFDVSPAMLRFARRRLDDAGVRARVARGRMESFAFARPFDVAHCLVSTFRYLLDEASAAAHLACVADALRPGGVYVLGLHVCDYDQVGCARERWTADR